MISVEEASQQIIDEYPNKEFSYELIKDTLMTMGGDKFICSDEMWRIYGKKKLYNTLLRKTHDGR